MPTFSKSERLCSKTTIERLYHSENRIICFPLSVRWMLVEPRSESERLQVLIVAPKKKLKHAVDRNRTKRVMRECYRMRKDNLASQLRSRGTAMALSVNYIHDHTPDFHRMEAAFDKMFRLLAEAIEKTEPAVQP
jgi:ribonuclease P protein component